MDKCMGLQLTQCMGQAIINYCMPGATYSSILETIISNSFKEKTTLIIFIGRRGNVNKKILIMNYLGKPWSWMSVVISSGPAIGLTAWAARRQPLENSSLRRPKMTVLISMDVSMNIVADKVQSIVKQAKEDEKSLRGLRTANDGLVKKVAEHRREMAQLHKKLDEVISAPVRRTPTVSRGTITDSQEKEAIPPAKAARNKRRAAVPVTASQKPKKSPMGPAPAPPSGE